MKNSTILAHWASKKCTSLGTTNRNRYYLFTIIMLLTFGAGNAWGETWEKVTSSPSDWSGEYLIVCESEKVAFNGALTTLDATQNIVRDLTINNNQIVALLSSSKFTIAKNGSGYTIKSASGYYIGTTSNSNGLNANKSTKYENAISLKSDCTVEIKSSGGAFLRYNSVYDQSRFRYYKSSSYTSQEAICLYKKLESYSVTATSNNTNYGTVSVSGTTITATPQDGYTYADPAYTVTSGTATVKQDGNKFTVTPSTNCTVRINFAEKPKYTVTFDAGSGNCTTSSLIEESAGGGVTLPTPEIDCGDWEFAGWATSSVGTETEDEPELWKAGSNYKPTTSCTLYAVYQRTEEGSGASTPQKEIITIDNFSTGTSTRTYSPSYATWKWAKNSGSNIADYEEIRMYAYHSMTITPKLGYMVSKIVAKCTSESYAKALGGGKLEGATTSVSGSSVTVTPTMGSIVITQYEQSRVSQFEVTYAISGGDPIVFYHSTPTCDPCASLAVPIVTVTNITSTSFTISWNVVDGATSYNVYNYTTEDLDETTSTTYAFSGLSANTAYEWEVESVNGDCATGTTGTTTTSAQTFTVSYDLNGATGTTPTEEPKAAGDKLKLAASTGFSQTGYRFMGWYDGTDTYDAGAQYTMPAANVTLTAQWEKEYKVIYDANGGSTTCAGGTYIEGEPAEVCTIIPTKEGHTFVDWTYSPNVTITNGVFIMPASDVTVTANYSELPDATLKLSINGVLTDFEGNYKVGEKVILPIKSEIEYDCSKELVGWDTDKDCAEKPDYEPGATYTLVDEENMLYAVFATPGTTDVIKPVEKKYTFSNYTEGKQYAQNEEHKLDDVLTLYTTECHFTTELRIYSSSTHNGYVESNQLPGKIVSMGFNAGYKKDNLIVYGSADGSTWTQVGKVTTATTYNDYTLDFGGSTNYTYFKLDVEGDQQIRIAKMSITYMSEGGVTTTYSDYTTSCGATPTIYNVTIAGDIQNGSVTASPTSAEEGATITLTVTPEDGYVLDALTVTDAFSTIKVTDNKFTMPASNVTVSATFKQDESGEVESNSTATIVFASNENQEDGSSDVITEETEIDEVVAQGVEFVSGFTDVKKVYPNSVHGLKLGTSKAIGKITIGLNISKKVSKITFKIYQYKEKEATIKFSAGGKVGSTSEFGDYTLTFDDPTTVSEIVISTELASKGRAYVSQIDIELAEDEAGEGGEDPVVPTPTVNPTATFVFNTADGLRKLGIAYPTTAADGASKKTNIENNTTVISNGVGLTMTGGTTTATRVWLTPSGVLDLRVYEGATLTFAVADGLEIIKVDFEGSELTNLAVDDIPMTGTIWEGNQKSVTFENQSNGVKINTIAVTVAYTRNVTKDEYGTICLPYGSSNYSGAEFYEVAWLRENAGLYLDEIEVGTALEAGKPYIFKATENELVVVYEGDAKDKPVKGKNGLTGTFSDIAANNTILEGNYIIAENKIWICGAGCWLNANRAYIMKSGLPTTEQALIPGRRRVCMGENAATGVDNLMESGVISAEQATKLLINGQLIIIRNGEKYNVQGQKL